MIDTMAMEYVLVVLVPSVLVGLGVIVLIIIAGQIIKARVSAISKSSFEKLANTLKDESAQIMTELAAMREGINSINKMMKEIE